MELLHTITKATPLDGLRVRVEFDDGETVGIYDCKPLTKDAYWSRLLQPEFFKTARAEYGTLVWNDNIDVAPESVWEDAEISSTHSTPRLKNQNQQSRKTGKRFN